MLSGTDADRVADGAYVVCSADDPDVVLIGTGSELQLCVGAAEQLAGDGIEAVVISMPCWELVSSEFTLPTGVPTLAVEAGTSFGWDRWADATVTIDRFGGSAPGSVALAELGFTVDAVIDAARGLIDS